MKHIEYSSDAWNTSPSREATLFESAVDVLKSSLGKRWPVSVLGLIALLFSPVAIFTFRKEIKFDAALFVTEWLKLSIEGILFFFILEIVRHRSMSFTARRLMLNFVTTNYVIPIQSVIASLKQFKEALNSNTAGDQSIMDARQKWTALETALSDEALFHLPQEEEMLSWLWKWRNELELERCNDILSSLSRVRDAQSLNQLEFDEIVNGLESFLTKIKNHYRSGDFSGGKA